MVKKPTKEDFQNILDLVYEDGGTPTHIYDGKTGEFFVTNEDKTPVEKMPLLRRYKVLEELVQKLLDMGYYPREIKAMAKQLYTHNDEGKSDE